MTSGAAQQSAHMQGDHATPETPETPAPPAPPAAVSAARATLDAWREAGADRADPIRFRLIDAMDRRASHYRGATRRLLDERIGKLLAEYGEAITQNASTCANGSPDTSAQEAETLRTLVAHITTTAPGHAAKTTYPELDALDYFREVWAKVRTDMQLRQSLEQVPGNAGPLNSSSLVHRSLSLMRELSPGYLKQFLSYVDALSWMEQLNGGIAPIKEAPRKEPARKETARKETSRAAGSGKGSRGKTR